MSTTPTPDPAAPTRPAGSPTTPRPSAEQLERFFNRKRLRRKWFARIVVVAATVLVLAIWALGYILHRHWLAASTLNLAGASVHWELRDGAWRHGGASHVTVGSGWAVSNLDDADLKALTDLRNLETLTLTGCFHVTDNGLVILRELPRIKSLTLVMTRPHPSYPASPLSDGIVNHFKGLRELEDLSLVDVNITDNGLKRFPRLPNLRFLDLTGTNITDNGLTDFLGRLPELETLALDRTAVTDAGVASLRRQRPGLVIIKGTPTAPTY